MLARTLPGFRFRAQQLAMAEAVADAIVARAPLVAEAGTGTGKTFAYLVPALLYGGKVIVSTGTKTLQDQLFERDLPLVRDALALPVTIALLKGRANYVCHHHLERAVARGPPAVARRRAAPARRSSRFAHASRARRSRRARRRARERVDLAAGHVDARQLPRPELRAFHRDCFVMKARKDALEADVVVVNHHLFFADVMLRDEGLAELLPRVQHGDPRRGAPAARHGDAVLRRAGRRAASSSSSRATPRSRRARRARRARAARRRGRPRAGAAQAAPRRRRRRPASSRSDARARARRLHRRARRARRRARPRSRPSWRTSPSAARTSRSVARRAERRGDAPRALARRHRRRAPPDDAGRRRMDPLGRRRGARRASCTRRRCRSRASSAARSTDDRPRVDLHVGHARGGRRLHALHGAARPRATRAPALGQPVRLRDAGAALRAARPAARRTRASTPTPSSTPRCRCCGRAAAARSCCSRRCARSTRARAAGRRVRARRPRRCRCSCRATARRPSCSSASARSATRCCSARASFWEGVDVPGDALSVVVIDKLPFAPPDDPLLAARLARARGRGRQRVHATGSCRRRRSASSRAPAG